MKNESISSAASSSSSRCHARASYQRVKWSSSWPVMEREGKKIEDREEL